MRQDVVVERLEFVKIQIRSAERAFMGGGYIHAAHDMLDKFQISFSSHPSVLTAIRETRGAITEFLKAKINSRLDGESGDYHPVAVWHAFNRMEQSIRLLSVAGAIDPVARPARLTVAA